MRNSQPESNITRIVGLAILGAAVAGGAGLLLALIAFFNDYDYAATAQALLVAAVAFGLLSNALLRE